MSTLEFVEVSKAYDDARVVDRLDLTIESGEFFVLLGPSGCGKSTLLKLVAGLEPVSSGEIYLDDELINYVDPGQRDVAMVFQSYALYPHMTVRENVAFPLTMRKRDRATIATEVDRAATLLGLEPLLDRGIGQLSGGQRQRVALARALVRQPRVMLMDEPLSNLDALLRVQTREELLRLHRRVPGTVVYVTHDQIEAMTMGDRIGVMRDGVLQQIGTPETVYWQPATTFVATFIGSPQMNLVEGRVEGDGTGSAFVGAAGRIALPALAPDVAAGVRTAGIRPEDIGLVGDEPDALPAVVILNEMLGADRLVVARAGEVDLRVRVPSRVSPAEGERVGLHVSAAAVHLFDEHGRRIDAPARAERR